MSESAQGRKHDDSKRSGPADFPEIALRLCRIDKVGKVHAVVAGEEGEGEEDDCDDGEDHDGFVLGFGDDGEFVLLDGTELEELGVSVYMAPEELNGVRKAYSVHALLQIDQESLESLVLCFDNIHCPHQSFSRRFSIGIIGSLARSCVVGFEFLDVELHYLEELYL